MGTNTHTAAVSSSGGGSVDFFQCKMCGMSFASEPSWKKHLFLLHRIKKPEPDQYCQDLVATVAAGFENMAAIGGEGSGSGASSESSEQHLVIDEDAADQQHGGGGGE